MATSSVDIKCCIPCEILSSDTLVPCCSKNVHHRMHRECLQQFIVAIIENQTEDYRTPLLCPLCRDNYLEQLRELFETSIKKRITTSPAAQELPLFEQMREVMRRVDEQVNEMNGQTTTATETVSQEIIEFPLSEVYNEMATGIMQNRFDFRDHH